MDKWKCAKCGKLYKEKASYKANLGLSFSLNPEKDICLTCYNNEVNKR